MRRLLPSSKEGSEQSREGASPLLCVALPRPLWLVLVTRTCALDAQALSLPRPWASQAHNFLHHSLQGDPLLAAGPHMAAARATPWATLNQGSAAINSGGMQRSASATLAGSLPRAAAVAPYAEGGSHTAHFPGSTTIQQRRCV